MTVPTFDDDGGGDFTPPVANATLDCSPLLWQPGAVLIRDPQRLNKLILLPLLPGLVNYTTLTVPLLAYYNVTEWDMLASFNGSHVHLFGPQRPIAEGDPFTGAGALGARDRPEGFNSWAAVPVLGEEAWKQTTEQWYNKYQSIRLFDPSTVPGTTVESSTGGSASSNSTGSSSSTASARRLLQTGSSSSTGSGTGGGTTGGSSSPFFSDPLIEAASYADTHGFGRVAPFYLFNNRTDVHIGAYKVNTPSSPSSGGDGTVESGNSSSSSSTGGSGAADSSSSSTGASSSGTNDAELYPPHPNYNPLPFSRMRLFVLGQQLHVCGERFVQPSSGTSSSSSSSSSSTGSGAPQSSSSTGI
jgi:hypothetical protein